MQVSRSSTPDAAVRRLILGTAFAIGLFAALAPHTEVVFAADPGAVIVAQAGAPRAPDAPGAAGESTKGDAKAAPPAPPRAVTPSPDAEEDADGEDADSGKPGATHGIIIEKGNKRIRIEGIGHDREYDSFEQFVKDAPWLAGLVFLTVLLVFLVPLLIIVLLIWYKMRKNRLANETMLKLAERGVVPPAVAMEAVASGAPVPPQAAAAPSGMPAYDYARALQRRTVWSDLRKGIVLTGVGLGLSLFSILDDGTPNSVGLVFLFVGLGYCLLWYFEDGTGQRRRDPGSPPPPGSA